MQARTYRKQADGRSRSRNMVKPPDGWVKINVDASSVPETGCAGTSVVPRDNAGRIKLTAWQALFNCASAVEAEALACVDGIRLASQWC
jgi:hypothetical protein